jgi:hypothetical protein
MIAAAPWTTQRNLTRPTSRETLIYIIGRLSRGETLPDEILVLMAEHPDMWKPKSLDFH